MEGRMAYNLECFSNWREESLPDQQPEEAGVHLAGSRFPGRPAPDVQDTAGCAVHGWNSPHQTSACLVIMRMDSATWANTVIAVGACVRCGVRFHRGHRCPPDGHAPTAPVTIYEPLQGYPESRSHARHGLYEDGSV